MKENLLYIQALHAAVIAIDGSDWETWSAAHSSDPYFEKINARLLILMEYYDEPSIDSVCSYMVTNDLIPDEQVVPSELFWPYKLNARRSDDRGVIRKRAPEHLLRPSSGRLLGAPGSHRWGTWEVFKKACDCLELQPVTTWNSDKEWGPIGRDQWYSESSGSGLFWLNYFMQMTLDYIYGPGKPNVWPFQVRTPPWCNSNKFYWYLSAYDWNEYAALGIVYFPPAGMSYGSGLTLHVCIRPDDSNGNPGNMEQGHLASEHASMNEDWECEGEYSYSNLSPLPAEWTAWPLTCAQHADDSWLYQYLEFLEMSGDYEIDIFVSSELNYDEPDDIYYDEFGGLWT